MSDAGTPEAARVWPNEEQIPDLVYGFYAKVRIDEDLGPIFSSAIADWDSHLEKMCAFWSSVMRMSGRYHGKPVAAHLRLQMVRLEHLQRWLCLFAETARDLFTAGLAEASLAVPRPSLAACSSVCSIGLAP